ncbi:MAG: hypothetical protein IK122_04090 [Alphaproteobacteria bacterium]|nr:hypothetical protein [Alphaproteobacteria bacterium]
MKKVILSVLGLALVAGCSGYDYYKTNVRYRQSGKDCIYYYDEKGKEFNSEIRNLKDAKQVVYRNTKCEDLYGKDSYGYTKRDRNAIVPARVEEEAPVSAAPACGCNKCAKKQTLKSRYIIIPSYAG